MAGFGNRGNLTKTDDTGGVESVAFTGTDIDTDKFAKDAVVLNTVKTDSVNENSRLLLIEDSLACQQKSLDKIENLLELQLETLGSTGVVKDGHGEGHRVKVSSRGQLITAPLDFSSISSIVLDTANVPFNLVPPLNNKQFVVTDLILYGDRNIGVNDASVQIYQADSFEAPLGGGDASISLEIVKQTTVVLGGLNNIIDEGKWLTAITNDNNIFANVAGYYVDALKE